MTTWESFLIMQYLSKIPFFFNNYYIIRNNLFRFMYFIITGNIAFCKNIWCKLQPWQIYLIKSSSTFAKNLFYKQPWFKSILSKCVRES